MKTADYGIDCGFGLRGVSGEMTGFAHADEISEGASAAHPKHYACSILRRQRPRRRRAAATGIFIPQAIH